MCVHSQLLQSCPTLCDPMDCHLPGFSVHGSFQVRILNWVAMLSSRGYSWPRDQTRVSCIAGRFFTYWITWETPGGVGWEIISGSCVLALICWPGQPKAIQRKENSFWFVYLFDFWFIFLFLPSQLGGNGLQESTDWMKEFPKGTDQQDRFGAPSCFLRPVRPGIFEFN